MCTVLLLLLLRLRVGAAMREFTTRDSLAFDDRDDALPPAPRGRSRSCCSVAETNRVVVLATAVDATAPGGNSSAESVAASSSFAVSEEPFAIAADPPVGSADLGCSGARDCQRGWVERT